MSNNKQSSVEWAIEKITMICAFYNRKEMSVETFEWYHKDIVTKAKAMHKEETIQNCAKMQIIDDVDFDGNVTFIFDPEQYYEQTYGGGEQWTTR